MKELNLVVLILAIAGFVSLLLIPLFSFIRYKLSLKSIKTTDHIQPVSIIITCFNEENFIKQRMDYFLNETEWIENSELIVISTGSTDKTNEILNGFKKDDRVRVILIENRLSKIKTLNLFIEECKNEIIIFSDCRQLIEKNAVKNLVRHFSDQTIAVVSSTLEDTKHKKKISFIRTVLNRIALWESKDGSSLNLFGALYAQRKIYFQPFPEDLLFDDLFVVVSTLHQNKRLVQDKDAVIRDIDFHAYYQKERIERLVRGLLIFFHNQKRLIFGLKKRLLIRFLAFKYLKLLMPYLLIIIIFELIYFSFGNERLMFFLMSLFTLPLLLPAFRKTAYQLILINFYFVSSTFKFYLKKERNNNWKPLQFKENRQSY